MKFIYFLLSLMLFPLAGQTAQRGVVAGSGVALRRGPRVSAQLIARFHTGRLASVLSRSKQRDKSVGGPHGFHWYRVRIHNGPTGWITGRYFYIIDTKKFFQRGASVAGKRVHCGGTSYRFGIAAQPAFPVHDKRGLTGSETLGLPFLEQPGKRRVLPIFNNTPYTITIDGRKHRLTQGWIRLKSSSGIVEEVRTISRVKYKGKNSLRLRIEFQTQTGSGHYHLYIMPRRDRFLVIGADSHFSFDRNR